MQFVQTVAGAGVDQQVADLDHHAAEQLRVDGHLQLDRIAGQSGQGVAEALPLGLVDLVGRLDPGHPPAPGLGRLLDQASRVATMSRARPPRTA